MQDTFQQRLEFLGLDTDAAARLEPIAGLIAHHVEIALERLDAKLAKTPSAARFLYGRDRFERNGEGLAAHWRALASGQFDVEFARVAQQVGVRHARIGLDPRWHLGSYASVVETLIKGIVRDGMAAALQPRQKFALFGRADATQAMAVAEMIAEGLATLMAGVLLDIDLSVSGYIGKLRDDGNNGVELQRRRLRLAVGQAGKTLEMAAEGQRTSAVEVAPDPDMAPLHAGAERLADKVAELIGDLGTSNAAMRQVAAELVDRCGVICGAREAQQGAAAALARGLTDEVYAATQALQALGGWERQVKSLARRRAGWRKSLRAAESAVSGLKQKAVALDGMAEQLNALHLSAQVLAAQDDNETLRALSAGLGRLAGQFRGCQVQSIDAHEAAVEHVAGLQTALDGLANALSEDISAMGEVGQQMRRRADGLEQLAGAAHALGDVLADDAARSQNALQALRDALAASEGFADLIAAFEPELPEQAPTAPCQWHDQAALAAHWHVG